MTAVVVVTGCTAAPSPPAELSAPAGPAMDVPPSSSNAPKPGPTTKSMGQAPTRLSAPAIDLDEPLIGLGLTDDGQMQVPSDYDDVGWFTGGGRPGAIGSPTVLAGHVDSTTGPAVFDRLSELLPGDVVTMADGTGGRADYRIDRIGDYGKAEFPTALVFGAVPADEIRLITCSGDFDTSVGSYDRNLVVYGVRQ
ncbi:class F sortase [Rhodococcoides yunnanense]|uniref:Class F sortase n=1 Tax=Rhodococcoides yunnanense TaxID=278209 RepID=A0ABU4BHD3_9NOCA|nr:class F sortase [Rhodococcus yunnanensis]MDV6263615.1 class F sortase [Rhodococcus yunnanensis]